MEHWLCLVAMLFSVQAICMDPCDGAKVLAVPSVILDSHLRIFVKVAEAMNSRGHETVLLLHEDRAADSLPQGCRVHRYRGIFSTESADDWLQEKLGQVFEGKVASLGLLSFLEKDEKNCDLMLGNSSLLQHLQSEDFDLVLTDINEMCGFIMAHLLGVKYVAMSTSFWFPAEIGATAPMDYIPEFNSMMTGHTHFLGRIWNFFVFILSRITVRLVILPRFDYLMEKHGVEQRKSMPELIYDTSLFLLSNTVALDLPRPTLPHVIFVGGIPGEPAKPLPTGLRLWVEGAEAGVVVVSFGDVIRALPQDLVEKMAGAFARLPQKVVWRYHGQKPKNLGENTLMMENLPQNDLLGHPSVIAVVSHCDANSVYEAIYHGVPIIGFPVFGDQFDIMTLIQTKGMGILMNWQQVSEERLHQALCTVISNSSFHKAAKKFSELLLDTQMLPLHRTVYWLEYVLRHNGAAHLQPSLYKLSFYEYYFLDMLAVLLLCLGGTLYIAYRLCLRYRKSEVHLNDHSLNGHVPDEKKGQ